MKNSLRTLMFAGAVLGALHSNDANAFDKSMVLPASTTEYLKSVEKELKDYSMKGVHGAYFLSHNKSNCLTNLVNDVKDNHPNAEVVVNFRYAHDNIAICSGLALIPREKTK